MLSLLVALALASSADADRLRDILLDKQAGTRFAVQAARSVLELRVEPKGPEWAEGRVKSTVGALAIVVVDGAGDAHVVTSGPLCDGARKVEIRSPSGRWIGSRPALSDDGATCALRTNDFFFWAEVRPVSLDVDSPLRKTRPVLTVGNPGGTLPTLIKGAVFEVMGPPLTGLFIVDLPFPLGTPLLAPDGRLVGLSFRPHPKERHLTVAVTAKKIDAWLRTKSSTNDR